MYCSLVLHPLPLFILSFFFFYLAVQRRLDTTRNILGIASVFSIILCLCGNRVALLPHPHIWVPFSLGIIMHTVSILFLDKYVLDLGEAPFAPRFRAVFRIWTNLRKLQLVEQPTVTPRSIKSRITFPFWRVTNTVALWGMYRLALLTKVLRWLHVRHADFAPREQGLLPPTRSREFLIRAVMSIHWIWSSYAVLASAHNLLAVVFVAILCWDQPAEWPPIFGSVYEAYSLCRFWGVFWQGLHVALFAAYMPPFLNTCLAGRAWVGKALRAGWMFLLSAFCHALVNWIVMKKAYTAQEIGFFLSNYALCLVETLAGKHLEQRAIAGYRWTRPLGYAWVAAIFFTLVPAWQYPLIYSAIGH